MLAPCCHFASSFSTIESLFPTDPTSMWCLRIFPGPAVKSLFDLRLAAQWVISTPNANGRASVFQKDLIYFFFLMTHL
jgi:hypothetical protein